MFRRIRTDQEDKADSARASIMRRPERRPEADARQMGVELPVQAETAPPPDTTTARLAKVMPKVPTQTEDDAETKRRQRLLSLRVDLHGLLLDSLNLAAIEKVPASELKAEIADITREYLAEASIVLNKREFDELIENLVHEVVGLGPLEPLLADDSITDILVNTHEQCYIERGGRLVTTDVQFKDNHHLMRIINKIVSAVGRRVDESQPWVDARLADGSRVNALVPPCAVDGPLLSIRKFSKKPFTVEKLIEYGAFS